MTEPAAPAPAFAPHIFGKFFVLEPVAKGGMAEIFRAKQFGASGFYKEVALKRVHPKLVADAEFLSMLTNEAKIAVSLAHGNIAQVYELFLADGVYCIAMEYVEGISARALARAARAAGKPLTPHEAAFVVLEALSGLDYAHRKSDSMGRPLGIVHADVSPDNIAVSYEGVVKVLDFGIARAQASFSNYKEGMVMGKLNYVAPEQATGKRFDARADVFSAGIVLYELCTGEHPISRKGDMDTLIKIARLNRDEIIPPSRANPAVPPDLEDVIWRALERDPAARYPSAAAMHADLVGCLFPATPAQLGAALSQRIQELFQESIAQRRAARSRDDDVIAGLRRHQAVAAGQIPDMDTIESGAEVGNLRAWLVPLLVGALAGVVAFAGAALFASSMRPAMAIVHSDPPGAEILLDRQPVGHAPLILEKLAPRVPVLVTARMPGRREFSQTFAPKAGEVVRVDARLLAQKARLRVATTPSGAALQVDGRDFGRTPAVVDGLEVGRAVKLRLVHEGYPPREWTEQIREPEARVAVDLAVAP